MRAAVGQTQPLVIIRLRQRHRAAAVFARPKGLVRRDLNIPAAHFAFDNCHLLVLLSSSVGELDIRPVGNVALTVFIVANGNRRAICFQTNCVRPFGADCRSIRPFGNIRLTVVVAIRS